MATQTKTVRERLLEGSKSFCHASFITPQANKTLHVFEGTSGTASIAAQCAAEALPCEDGKNKVIFINYNYKNCIEAVSSTHPGLLGFPITFSFFVPAFQEYIAPLPHPPDPGTPTIHLNASETPESYVRKVTQLKRHISRGDIYEANFCINFTGVAPQGFSEVECFLRLLEATGNPFSAFIKCGPLYLLCASPERFVSRTGNRLFSQPMKGTASRKADKEADHLNAKMLSESVKEKSENVMIVDLVRNDMSRVAKKGTVRTEDLFKVETYPRVHQMISTISCELEPKKGFRDIIRALFPMGSMTGAPKIKAMELLDLYEDFDRGPFSGTIGYMKDNGDFDLNVLIRSIFYNSESRQLSFSVGSAITAQADAAKEYEECMLKAQPLLEALNATVKA